MLRVVTAVLLASAACSPSKDNPASATTEPSNTTTEPATTPPPVGEPAVGADSNIFETAAGPLELVPIHHGTLAFRFAGKTILVDPWSKAGELPKADLILITDIHQDHMDPAAIDSARQDGTVVIAPKAVAETVTDAQVLANGETTDQDGIGIEAIPMYNHTRGPEPGKLFHDKGRGNGYLLTFGDTRVYLSGDTACTDEMKALTDIDLALVCMNLPYTMPPAEAAECVAAFKPAVVVPYHYRGSNLDEFTGPLEGTGVEVRLREFYAP